MGGQSLTWWALLFGLGAFHGINPAMGWLFAVARGLQEGSRRAAWGTVTPLAVGHFAAIGAAIAVVLLAGELISGEILRWPLAALLIGLGSYQLVRHRNPRYRGMRVGAWQLAVWSFLMASIHGAGLMVIPLFLSSTAAGYGPEAMSVPMGHPTWGNALVGLGATLVHGAGYLFVTALVAAIVYEKVGVGVLRKAWINLHLVWAVALIVTGGLTLLV